MKQKALSFHWDDKISARLAREKFPLIIVKQFKYGPFLTQRASLGLKRLHHGLQLCSNPKYIFSKSSPHQDSHRNCGGKCVGNNQVDDWREAIIDKVSKSCKILRDCQWS
jgi:hypothetical protein